MTDTIDYEHGTYRQLFVRGPVYGERFNAVSLLAQNAFFRLMCIMDQNTIFIADPRKIRLSAFPAMLEQVSEGDVVDWLNELASVGLIRRYHGGSNQFGVFLDSPPQPNGANGKATKSASPKAPTSIDDERWIDPPNCDIRFKKIGKPVQLAEDHQGGSESLDSLDSLDELGSLGSSGSPKPQSKTHNNNNNYEKEKKNNNNQNQSAEPESELLLSSSSQSSSGEAAAEATDQATPEPDHTRFVERLNAICKTFRTRFNISRSTIDGWTKNITRKKASWSLERLELALAAVEFNIKHTDIKNQTAYMITAVNEGWTPPKPVPPSAKDRRAADRTSKRMATIDRDRDKQQREKQLNDAINDRATRWLDSLSPEQIKDLCAEYAVDEGDDTWTGKDPRKFPPFARFLYEWRHGDTVAKLEVEFGLKQAG